MAPPAFGWLVRLKGYMQKIAVPGAALWESGCELRVGDTEAIDTPCRHSRALPPQRYQNFYGAVVEEPQWQMPPVVVVAYNEAGCASTGVCLWCVVEAAKAAGIPVEAPHVDLSGVSRALPGDAVEASVLSGAVGAADGGRVGA